MLVNIVFSFEKVRIFRNVINFDFFSFKICVFFYDNKFEFFC